jgi:hypothetical protein
VGLSVFLYAPLIVAVFVCFRLRLASVGGKGRRAGYRLAAFLLPIAASLALAVGVCLVISDEHARAVSTTQGAFSQGVLPPR